MERHGRTLLSIQPPAAYNLSLRTPVQRARIRHHTGRRQRRIPGARTADPFVYATSAIAFINPTYPTLLRNEFINARTSPGETLSEGIRSIFHALLGADQSDHTLKVVVRYGYALASSSEHGLVAPDAGSIISEIPVVYYHKFAFEPAFEAELASALGTWSRHHAPAARGGMYLFELTVYSTLLPELIQPTLTLRRVAFTLDVSS